MAGEAPLSFGSTVSLSATTSTGRVALSTKPGNQVIISNNGPDKAYVTFGDSTVTASTAGLPIFPGVQTAVTIGSQTYAAAICPTSTAVVEFTAANGYVAGVSGISSGSASPDITVGTAYGGVKVAVTRPNDTNAYTAGDVVGGAFEITSMGPSGGRIMLTSSQFEWDINAIPSGATSFTLYLYSVTPPSTYADNAAWDLPVGDRASYLGFINLGTPIDLGSTCYVEQNIINKQIKLAGTSLFAYCVTAGGYTPAAQTVQQFTLHSVGLGL